MHTDINSVPKAPQQVFSMSNGAPFDFFEFFDQIVDSSANSYEKLIALILARHVGKNSEAAFPSRARIMLKASCSLATFKRSQSALAAFFTSEERSGRSTLYAPKPLITVVEIEAAIKLARDEEKTSKPPIKKETRYPTEPGPGISQHPGPERAGALQSQGGALIDTQPGIPQTPHNDSSKGKPKKEDSVPDGTGSELPEASLRDLVWGKCISWLLPRSCLDEVRLRARVGKWVQEFGAGAVIDAVAVAQKEAPVSIMAYVEGVLRRKAQPRREPVDWKKRRDDDDFIRKMAGIEGCTTDEYRRRLAADGVVL